MLPGAYSMAITNTARFIRSARNSHSDSVPLDAYTASETLAVAFCKAKGEVLADILSVSRPHDPAR